MSLAYKISGWNRRRKWQLFLDNFRITPKTSILDVGFSEQEYSETDNFLEKNYPYTEQITALTLDVPEQLLYARQDPEFQVSDTEIIRKREESSARYPQLKVVSYDGHSFPFPDQSFDICWSNAVLEHVGDREKQIFFLQEIKRVSKGAFITTPNKNFPIEVHTRIPLLHFLPKEVFDRCLCFVDKEWASGEYMYLLSLKQIHQLLKAAGINKYQIIKKKILMFTLDFVIII